MMRALADLGHEILLATNEEPSDHALGDVPYAGRVLLPSRAEGESNDDQRRRAHASYLSERFRRYWGIEHVALDALEAFAADKRIDALVAVGLEALPYLTIRGRFRRVWYAADEWFLHHMSLVTVRDVSTLVHVKPALIKLAYERAHAHIVDRVWVVSPADLRAMRTFGGFRGVDLIPNGVDTDYFQASRDHVRRRTCVFWGRLDFEPNVQGVEWLVNEVWPLVKAQVPEATLDLLGFSPVPSVQALHGRAGVSVIADLPDLRQHIASCAVAVLPLISGRGIKNKTLEAASLGLPIVATSLACAGLRDGRMPVLRADSPRDFASSLLRLFDDPSQAEALGSAARRWVIDTHGWRTAALEATHSMESIDLTGARR